MVVASAAASAKSKQVFDKWDLHAVRVGDGDHRQPPAREGPAASSRPEFSTARSPTRRPVYHRPDAEPPHMSRRRAAARSGRARSQVRPIATTTLLTLLASPTIASKRWVYRQYDHMVAHQHHRRCRVMACGVVRGEGDRPRAGDVGGRQRALQVTSIPRRGREAGAWPRRRATSRAPAACRSARTNCLNFGNPERPEIMWQFAEAVDGHRRAPAARWTFPITGGNVSLYNETDGKAILPTPVLGVVGVIERRGSRGDAAAFKRSGDVVVLLGQTAAGAWRIRIPAPVALACCAGRRPRWTWTPRSDCSACSSRWRPTAIAAVRARHRRGRYCRDAG